MIRTKFLSLNKRGRSQAVGAGAIVVALTFLQGCALGSDPIRYEADTKSVIEFMAFDMPLPESAELDLGGTVIAGTGQNWSGRIAIVDNQTRGELLKFFVERGVETGWELRSTTVSDRMTVVMEKGGRVATIDIGGSSALDRGGLFGGGTAEGRTPVSITVNHENAVENQRPFGTVPGMLLELLPSLPVPAPTPVPPPAPPTSSSSGPLSSTPFASALPVNASPASVSAASAP